MLPGVLQPSRQMVECLATRNIVDEQSTGRTTIVRSSYGAERLLAGRIPDLQLNLFAVDCDHSGTEFDTDGQIVHGLEAFVGELQQKTRFADAYVGLVTNKSS